MHAPIVHRGRMAIRPRNEIVPDPNRRVPIGHPGDAPLPKLAGWSDGNISDVWRQSDAHAGHILRRESSRPADRVGSVSIQNISGLPC